MQVTGNNSEHTQKILSVRLRQGGLSFYFVGGDGRAVQYGVEFRDGRPLGEQIAEAAERFRAGIDLLQVFVDTDRTVYVPTPWLAESDPERLLAEAGIAMGASQMAVVTEGVQEVVAVTVAEAEAVEALRRLPARQVRFFSPLHEVLVAWERHPVAGGGVVVYPATDNVYIVRYDGEGRLVLAEVYPYGERADLVWYLTTLLEEERRNEPTIFLYGGKEAQLAALRSYFRRVKRFPTQKGGK